MRRHFLCALLAVSFAGLSLPVEARAVSSLGRIEPFNGVYQLAGPSDLSVVAELRVEEGDFVEKGEILATLDTYEVRQAEVKRAQVALDHARRALAREQQLKRTAVTSQARLDDAERDVQVGEAELVAAKAALDRAAVMAPVAGQVLVIHARTGERIGSLGLLELGETRKMYAVAEVYETDIGLVEVGQNAVISSPALPSKVTGKVERIGHIIGKSDVLALDPVARADSRVVEVFILLDDPASVASLTNLQVDVEIQD